MTGDDRYHLCKVVLRADGNRLSYDSKAPYFDCFAKGEWLANLHFDLSDFDDLSGVVIECMVTALAWFEDEIQAGWLFNVCVDSRSKLLMAGVVAPLAEGPTTPQTQGDAA